jgi:beta-glucosidase
VNAAGTANDSKVQLYDCNATGAQVWQAQSNGSLVNPESGRCLDDPAATTTIGTQLQIYDCNGSNAQVWHLP